MLVRPDTAALFDGFPGLLWALRFAADGSAELIEAADAMPASDLADPAGEGWLWLHFNQSDVRTVQTMARLPLPADARQALVSHDTHVILQLQDDGAYGVLMDWEHQRASEPSTRLPVGHDGLGWLHFALTERLLVTARRQPLRSVEVVRRQLCAGACLGSPVRVLEAITEQFADTVELAADGLSETLDRIEDRVLSDSIGDERRDLASLRHRTVRLHRPLTAMRRVLKQFEQRHAVDDEHELVPAASRLGQRFDDLDGDVASLQERARLLQDEVAAKLAERTNRHLYVLSMITALLLPPSLVVGVFGMNLHGLPFANHHSGALAALVVGGLSSLVVYAILRRLGVASST